MNRSVNHFITVFDEVLRGCQTHVCYLIIKLNVGTEFTCRPRELVTLVSF